MTVTDKQSREARQEREDGGPAFPHLGLYHGMDGNLHPTPTQHGGMSLRDYFASRAPQPPEGFMRGLLNAAMTNDELTTAAAAACARWSFVYADAMLKARGEAS